MHSKKTTKTQERVTVCTLKERRHHFGRGGKIGALTGDKVKVIKVRDLKQEVHQLVAQTKTKCQLWAGLPAQDTAQTDRGSKVQPCHLCDG